MQRVAIVLIASAMALAGVTIVAQSPSQRALELFNAGVREGDASKQIQFFRDSLKSFETFEGSVALADALLRAKRDPMEARELCSRAFSTLANPDAAQGRRMQATALVCLARSYRATNDNGTAVAILKRSLDIERTATAEQELREATVPEFRSAESIAGSLATETRSARSGLPRGALPVEVSTDIYINFDVNQATLAADGVRQVGELARALGLVGTRSMAPPRFKVIGHTDTRGTDIYNLDLSKRRAKTVADLLISKYGIAASLIEIEGKGKSAPLLTGDTEDVHARNRRVEVQVAQ